MTTDVQLQLKKNNLQKKESPIPRPLLVRNQNVCLDVKENPLSGNELHFYKSIQLKYQK